MFMDLKTARTVTYILLALVIGFYLLILAMDYQVPAWLWITALLCSLAYLTIFLLFWRCPHCRRHLGRASGEYCQHCGQSLY